MGLSTGTFVVNAGVPTQLLAQMPAGTLIVNNDSVDGVWISDANAVSPGGGFFLGPLGSLTWQNDGGACFACVDTGVVNPVSLTIGGAATNPDNPVSVGVAVATELLASGVPLTYTNKLAGLAFVQTLPFTTAVIDCHNFASLIFEINSSNSNAGTLNNVIRVEIDWYINQGGNLIDSQVITLWGGSVINTTTQTTTWTLPVKGDSCRIVITSSGLNDTVNFFGIGSSRGVSQEIIKADLLKCAPALISDSISLGAGVTQSYRVGPTHGPLWFQCTIGAAGTQFIIWGETIVNGVLIESRIYSVTFTNNAAAVSPIYAPGIALRVAITNTSGAAQPMAILVTSGTTT